MLEKTEDETAPKTSRRSGVPQGVDALMTVQQAMDSSGFGRTFVEKAIDSGELKSFRVGRNVRIRVSACNDWLDWLESRNQAA